jgi:di/tricarboxylate transporter
MFPGMTTESIDLVVLAIRRKEEDITRETTIAVGDTLLLQGAWHHLEYHLDDPDVLVVDEPALIRRQAVPLGPGAPQVLVIVAGMVILLVAGLVPPAVAGLLAAGAIILSDVLTVDQAYHPRTRRLVVLSHRVRPR